MIGVGTTLFRRECVSVKTAPAHMPVFFLYAGVFYNAFLAIVNAHVAQIGQGVVMAAEGLILAIAAAYLLTRIDALKDHVYAIGVPLLIYTQLFVWVSVTNQSFFVKSLRDFVIMFTFYLLGTQCTAAQLARAFRVIVGVTTGVLLIEGLAVDLYAAIFQPANYYANTRGIAKFALDDTGLFHTAFAFEGRFAYGLFGNRRLSSIFLEQVSLANFAMVLSIFVMTFWQTLGRWDKLLFMGAITLTILSTSSRMGTFFCPLMLFGYAIFPWLPRYSFRFMMPLALAGSFLLFYDPLAPVLLTSDDLHGRAAHTVSMLAAMDWIDLLAGNSSESGQAADSGFAYLAYTQTIFGLIYFWYFLATIFPTQTDIEKRFVQGATLYIVGNLMLGEGIFTIKVSAPLWLISGYLAAQSKQRSLLRLHMHDHARFYGKAVGKRFN